MTKACDSGSLVLIASMAADRRVVRRLRAGDHPDRGAGGGYRALPGQETIKEV